MIGSREKKKINQFSPGCLVEYRNKRKLKDHYRYFGMVLSNSDGYIKIKWWWSGDGPASVIEYINYHLNKESLESIQVLQ